MAQASNPQRGAPHPVKRDGAAHSETLDALWPMLSRREQVRVEGYVLAMVVSHLSKPSQAKFREYLDMQVKLSASDSAK